MLFEPMVISLDGSPKHKVKAATGTKELDWAEVAAALKKAGLLRQHETLKGFVVSEKSLQIKTETGVFKIQ